MFENKISKFERTLAFLLRPIARLMIANDFPLSRAVELMKRALIAEAQTNNTETDSHISLKTGVHRKDVKRLRTDNPPHQADQPPATPIAGVLTCWTQDTAFIDGTGKPRPLARRGNAEHPGFDALVKAAKIDLPAATVLSELLAQGIVTRGTDDQLTLVSDTYIPILGDTVLDALQATLVDHLNISVNNALSTSPDQNAFDRVLRYSHLSQHSVEQLEAASREAALAYLTTLNELAHSFQRFDETREPAPAGRFVTGVFIAPTYATPTTSKQDEIKT